MIIRNLISGKQKRSKWALLTAYDFPSAEIVARAGADFILVGDSLGMVVLGYESPKPVTMNEMIHHAKAVRRGASKTPVIGDLPFLGVHKGPRQALASARRFMDEAGCDAVKVEWSASAVEAVKLMRKNRIPVMGHVGLTPQTVADKKGYKVQGKTAADAGRILAEAKALEKAGCFAVLLECVPSAVADAVTRALRVPTIGIGAGPGTDGQVLVFHDVMGIFTRFEPRFVKRYARLAAPMQAAAAAFVKDVKSGRFPAKKHGFSMDREERRLFEEKSDK
jgi:3-methyl-2-oxobutanoate hydroxymethyltransferase